MKRIALVLEYDGSHFCGWQRQKNAITVEGVLNDVLSQIHKTQIIAQGSGRTDSGVHARGQVAHFDSCLDLSTQQYKKAINSLLPKSINVKKVIEVSQDFHARFDAKKRTYQYYMISKDASLFDQMRALELDHFPHIPSINILASTIIGEHDFYNYTKTKAHNHHHRRTIYESYFYYERGFLVYRITGNAFLWNMVRSLVGTFLEFEKKGKTYLDIEKTLLVKDRTLIGQTAQAKGLFLEEVEYDKI